MKTLKITFCLMFCCAVFVGNVFADEQIVLQIPDINFDSNIDMLDFSELAKYWNWKDLREQNNFETYQDYADFWDPNSLNPDSYHYVGFDAGGQQFDFNKDSLVDSLDLGLLAAYWLMPVEVYQRGALTFRETDINYDGVTDSFDLGWFSNYWMWFDATDPNNFETPEDYEEFWDPNTGDPNSFDTLGIYFDFSHNGRVNLEDFSILAGDWSIPLMEAPSNISVEFTGDLNYLDGFVYCEISGFMTYVTEIDVILDSKRIDTIKVNELSRESGVIDYFIETSKYSNGTHQLAFIGFDSLGILEVSDSFDIGFHNLLSNNVSSDYYTANGYFVSGTYEGTKNLRFTVSKGGSTVYSQTVTTSDVNIYVPAEMFSDDLVLSYEVSLIEVNEPNLPDPNLMGMFLVLASDDIPSYKDWKSDVYKKFDPSAYDPNTCPRIIFILPDKGITKARWDVISAEMEACQKRTVEFIVLFYKDVNHVNLDYVFGTLRRLNTVFLHGHMNSHIVGADGTDVERIFFQCWKLKEVPWWPDSYVESRAFVGRSPSNPLPDDWDTEGFFLWPYNLGMRFVLADGCNSAVDDDMYRAFCRNDNRYVNRAYCGWNMEVNIGTAFLDGLTLSDEGLVEMAKTFGRNDHLEKAMQNIAAMGGGVKNEFWGDDGFPGGMEDNFRVYISEFGKHDEIYLSHGW